MDATNEELAAAKRRADDAESRAMESQSAAADAELRLEQVQAAAAEDEGMKSLLHQRETALAEAQERSRNLETKAARFAGEASEAVGKLRAAEETLVQRDAEIAKALAALKGVEAREQRDKELMAELRGEVARLTEALDATRDDLRKASSTPIMGATAEELAKERDRAVEAAGRAQAETARVHADADSLRERLDQTSGEMQRLLAEAKRAQDLAAEKERRISELEAEILPLKSAKGRADSGDMERRSVQMSQRISVLEAELERAKDDVKQATAEARKYRALAEAIDPPADRAKG
jgi:chromosome segregation ATPase